MANSKQLEQKKNTKIQFIRAAQALIDTEIPENISIRKIADKAGFHNSTIYLYFNDIEQLIALSTLKYFSQYDQELYKLSLKNCPPQYNFYAVWEFFCMHAFQKPHAFHNFFFGKYCNELTSIITEYYELFPEEKHPHSQDIDNMYYGNNLEERCMKLLRPLIGNPAFSITDSNVVLINKITVSCFKCLLEKKCDNLNLDNYSLYQEFKEILDFITGKT